jgi:hypothetical protein
VGNLAEQEIRQVRLPEIASQENLLAAWKTQVRAARKVENHLKLPFQAFFVEMAREESSKSTGIQTPFFGATSSIQI